MSFIDAGGIIRGYGNTGKAVLEKFIHYQDIEKVDYVFLTHFHQDHSAGIEPLSSSFPELAVLSLPYFPNFSCFPLSSRAQLEIFPIQGKKENDQALVFRLTLPHLDFNLWRCGRRRNKISYGVGRGKLESRGGDTSPSR